jgi:hypothetical protein
MDERRILAMLATGAFAGLVSLLLGYSMSPYVGTYGGGLDYWLLNPDKSGIWFIVGFAVGMFGSLALHLWRSGH